MARSARTTAVFLVAGLAALAGCTGMVDHGGSGGTGPSTSAPSGGGPVAVAPGYSWGPQGLRRLSPHELRNALRDLLPANDAAIDEALAQVPRGGGSLFENDYRFQDPSAALVETVDALAETLAREALSGTGRDAFLGCTPTSPGDAACLTAFAGRFARLAFRRSLSASEIDEYAAFAAFGVEENDFSVAAQMIVRAVLQDPEFLYRIEIGQSVPGEPGLHRLGGVELASRLSFLLWGSIPDDALLTRAETGRLETVDDLNEEAARMIADPKAVAQIQHLHGRWLGYATAPIDDGLPIAGALRQEPDALVERAFLGGDWTALLTSDETFVDDELASHYGLSHPGGGATWVPYQGDRAGLLSHGAFLSQGAKFGDTSPVVRGKMVWTGLLCQELAPPPPTVDADVEPTGSNPNACKIERYDMRTKPECASCHTILDPIGFGLENFGPTGEWRDTEPGRPDCVIDHPGDVLTVGTFQSPRELGELLADSGQVEACFVRRLYQFAVGREVAVTDSSVVDTLLADFDGSASDLRSLLLSFVGNEGFLYRVVDQEL